MYTILKKETYIFDPFKINFISLWISLIIVLKTSPLYFSDIVTPKKVEFLKQLVSSFEVILLDGFYWFFVMGDLNFHCTCF